MNDSLWGEEFDIPDKEKTKKILNKISKPKQIKSAVVEKQVKSKSLNTDEKLKIINEEVLKKLSKQVDNVLVIRDRVSLHSYIDKAIKNNLIAIDTETNNSLDPITCKLMGLCIYTPGEKQVYVPINHIDYRTGLKLDNQLSEHDIKEELNYLLLAKTFILMHNGKFDYQVIKCTCNLELNIDWDTMIAAKLLDENEQSAGLKQQYISKIDPDQEKYSIDKLFDKFEYAIVNPDIFALYAATDALMTYKLYLWQKNKFETNDLDSIFDLFIKVEMPLVKVIAEMELNGMEVDLEYGDLLSKKYHKKLDLIDNKITSTLIELSSKIEAWKLTPEAQQHPIKKSGVGEGKSKSEQLTDPINLASPTQLAILFYDILKAPVVDKKHPRATGEDALKAINDKLKLPICSLLIERRALVKLITTYVDVIPDLAKRWPDGRVRTHFNQYGAATGRLSSSDPINFQNIPSHNKEIRMLFKSKCKLNLIESDSNVFDVPVTDEIETLNRWKNVKLLQIGEQIKLDDDNFYTITAIAESESKVIKITVE